MQLNLANCIELKYLKGLAKMLDLREIDLMIVFGQVTSMI